MRDVRGGGGALARLWRVDALDRRILVIAVPALGSLLVEPIYVITDKAVVGRLGTVPLGGLPVFVAVMLRPSLGLVTVWVGMLLWVCVRALKNHLRARGDTWLASADAVG